MNIKLWDRAEPLKSATIWVISGFVLVEAMLLFGSKWMLVDEEDGGGSDADFVNGHYIPATRSWRVLTCTYWTGRSTQTIEVSGEYNPVPMECPFIANAQ